MMNIIFIKLASKPVQEKFRTGNTKLHVPIEAGRYLNIPRENRI